MHELSIVHSIVTVVTDALAGRAPARVEKVRLRVGALSGVVEEALQFGYGIATEGTPLAGSVLEVVHLPLVLYCESCAQAVTLDGVQSFRCPLCGELSGDVRQGRELEIESIEVADTE
jgi:hydrogenase nickel incorporation protein HypA/HybF